MNPVLRVPVVRPDDSKALFHARSQLENRPAAMDLADNGTDVGGYELVSGWSDAAFSVPPRLLVTAVRSLTLSPES